MTVGSDRTEGGLGLIPVTEFADIIRREGIAPTVIYDIGACDGTDSERLCDAFPDAQVVAVEGLIENVARWLVPIERIITIPVVLAKTNGIRTFYVQDRNGLHGIYNRNGFTGIHRRVLALTLDHLCRDLPRPNVLHIDVEGAAWDVLMGGPLVLSGVEAIHVETETVPYFDGQVLNPMVEKLLELHGFRCLLQRGVTIGDGQQLDSVWVKGGGIEAAA